MGRLRSGSLAASLVLLLAACSGSTSPSSGGAASGSPGPASAPPSVVASSLPSAAPSTSVAPSASTSASPPASEEPSLPSAVPTKVDPCQLVTQDEASTLAGATLPPGKGSTFENNGRICAYGSTAATFTVEVTQALDQATVDVAKQQVLKQLQSAAGKGVKETQLSGIGDDAALITFSTKINGADLNGVAIYLLKGTYFVVLSDLGFAHPVATGDAMQAQAQTVVGRLP